jgi:photosystem II stability/assembly factor-like uncharacterized protein
MKKFLLVLLSIIVFSSISSAQWTQTNGPKGAAIGPMIKIADSEYAFYNSKYVYLSKDDCKTWKIVFTLPDLTGYAPMIMTIHHFDNKLYVGSSLGLFVSDETLENFVKQKDSYFQESIFAINSNDTAIYVASYVRTEARVNLYISSINNNQWESITTDSSGYINGFISDIALKDDKIYISSEGSWFDGAWSGPAMQVTTNGGLTWRTIKAGLTNTAITKICVQNNTILITSSEGGMFISSDQGENWQVYENESLPSGYSISDIKSNQQFIYLALYSYGIFRSSDNGVTWESINNGLQDRKPFSLVVDDEQLYASTDLGFFKYNKDENTWIEYNDGLIATTIIDMVVNNGIIYTSSWDFGLSKTTDGGDTWSKIPKSQFQKQVQKLAVDGNTIYAEGSDSLFVSTNNGSSWKNIKGNLVTEYGNFLYKSDKYLFACFHDGTYCTSNNGATWDTLKYDSKKIANAFDMIYDSGDLYLVNYDLGVLKSTDEGTTWNIINNGITEKHIYSIDLSGNRICAASNTGKVFLSEDRGENWALIKTSTSKYNVSSILLAENKIFAGTSYTGSPYVGDGVKLSLDNGLTWVDASSGLGNANTIKSLIKLDDYIYAGTANNSVYKAKISDFDYVGVKDEKQISNLIIASPPYPLPSKQIVNTFLNWSTEIDIANADMNIYNTLGEKVCGKEKINFQQQSLNSGIVTWNAEDNPSGVYFLHISVANEEKVISFVIE